MLDLDPLCDHTTVNFVAVEATHNDGFVDPGNVGNMQLRRAFNAAFRELVSLDEYTPILLEYGLEASNYSRCDEDEESLWPTEPFRGIFKVILEVSHRINIGRVSSLPGPPFYGETTEPPMLEDKLINAVVSRMSDHYQRKLSYNIISVVTEFGFFESMYKSLVVDLSADFMLGMVSITSERKELVDFSCSYISVRDGILRSELDPALDLGTIEKLNRTEGIIIGVLADSRHDQFVSEHLPFATKIRVPANETNSFACIEYNTCHVFLTDFPSEAWWLNQQQDKCLNCTVYQYGEEDPFGAFFRKANLTLDQMHSSAAPASFTFSSAAATFMKALLVVIATHYAGGLLEWSSLRPDLPTSVPIIVRA
eukprot:GEZU01017018.1.p1 GENE.GEZU01017018.1~~GEZU01017018.1.p1  ORF type:complete len:367 (+),score=69.55 GEZU01017018.1:772-1872(+)